MIAPIFSWIGLKIDLMAAGGCLRTASRERRVASALSSETRSSLGGFSQASVLGAAKGSVASTSASVSLGGASSPVFRLIVSHLSAEGNQSACTPRSSERNWSKSDCARKGGANG